MNIWTVISTLQISHRRNCGVAVRKTVNWDGRSNTSETAGGLGLSYGACQRTVHAVDLPEVCALVWSPTSRSRRNFWLLKTWLLLAPSRSIHLTPCDLFLFPRMNSQQLRGRHFQNRSKNSVTFSVRRACDCKSQFQRYHQPWQKPCVSL